MTITFDPTLHKNIYGSFGHLGNNPVPLKDIGQMELKLFNRNQILTERQGKKHINVSLTRGKHNTPILADYKIIMLKMRHTQKYCPEVLVTHL